MNPILIHGFHFINKRLLISYDTGIYASICTNSWCTCICILQVKDLAKKQKIETTDTCSALTGDNVENVFENAVIMYFKSLKRIRPQPSCTVV